MKREYTIMAYDNDTLDEIKVAIYSQDLLAALQDIALNMRSHLETYSLANLTDDFSEAQLDYVMLKINHAMSAEVEAIVYNS